eukprot:GEMP01026052.1.p1 GENE.GEMP01026052.1~~GEMP01026052.1.p1  ORF type:complete len:301 (+),score=57.03 GEMP01026052.1:454-1356(+)
MDRDSVGKTASDTVKRFSPVNQERGFLHRFQTTRKTAESATLARSSPKNVRLIVYDLDASLLRALTGIISRFSSIEGKVYHSGVEVYGVEWCYGYSPSENGIAGIIPQTSPLGTYSHSVEMGPTPLSVDAVVNLLEDLQAKWLGYDYHVIKRNCHNFCEELCTRLKVLAPFPMDINMLAESAQSSLAEGTIDWLFGDDDSAKFSVQETDNDEVRREQIAETYEYMREVWEEWIEEEQSKAKGNYVTDDVACGRFVRGTVCHAPYRAEPTFEQNMRHTLVRLRQLQSTIDVYRRTGLLPSR